MEQMRANNAVVAKLQSDFRAEAKDTTINIKKIYGVLTDYSEYFWPVVYKVFPNLAIDEKKMSQFIFDASKDKKK